MELDHNIGAAAEWYLQSQQFVVNNTTNTSVIKHALVPNGWVGGWLGGVVVGG